jgi:hypothetical protein
MAIYWAFSEMEDVPVTESLPDFAGNVESKSPITP